MIDSRTLYTYHIYHIHQFYSIITLSHCDWHSYALFISHPLFYHIHQFYSIITLSHCDWHSYALYTSHSLFYHIHQFYSIITLYHYDWHSYALFISHHYHQTTLNTFNNIKTILSPFFHIISFSSITNTIYSIPLIIIIIL